jgi:hypothetical protein
MYSISNAFIASNGAGAQQLGQPEPEHCEPAAHPLKVPSVISRLLYYKNPDGFRPLWPILNFELDSLELFEGPVAFRRDPREVHEEIRAVIPLDKAVTLRCIEPLHSTCHFLLPRFFFASDATVRSGTDVRARRPLPITRYM